MEDLASVPSFTNPHEMGPTPRWRNRANFFHSDPSEKLTLIIPKYPDVPDPRDRFLIQRSPRRIVEVVIPDPEAATIKGAV